MKKKISLVLLALTIASIFILNLGQASKGTTVVGLGDDDGIIDVHCIPITKWKF